MADRELRKMKRAELIEVIYLLKQNEARLQEENERLKRQLADRTVRLENAGSIAQASLELADIFTRAQEAADIYLRSVRLNAEKRSADTTDHHYEKEKK